MQVRQSAAQVHGPNISQNTPPRCCSWYSPSHSVSRSPLQTASFMRRVSDGARTRVLRSHSSSQYVTGVCTGLQIPHTQANLLSQPRPVLHRVAFPVVSEWCQYHPRIRVTRPSTMAAQRAGCCRVWGGYSRTPARSGTVRAGRPGRLHLASLPRTRVKSTEQEAEGHSWISSQER